MVSVGIEQYVETEGAERVPSEDRQNPGRAECICISSRSALNADLIRSVDTLVPDKQAVAQFIQ